MKVIFKKWLVVVWLALLGAFPVASSAAWPDDQTIELIVGFAPGGGTDLMARALVPFVEKKLGGKAKYRRPTSLAQNLMVIRLGL